jgi:hypothetical protein
MIRNIVKHEPHIRKKAHFPYEIAVITGGNSILLRDTTLNILKAYQIPYNKITVFLQTKSEEEIYKTNLLSSTYGKLISTDTRTKAELYNWIQSYYIPGTPIVYVKDCIKYILEYGTHGIQPLKSLIHLIKLGFSECTKLETCMWGVSPTIESASRNIHHGVSYLPGSLWGFINPGPLIQVTQSILEDYERCIKVYKRFGSLVQCAMIIAVEYTQLPVPTRRYEKALDRLLKNYSPYITIHSGDPVNTITLHTPECKIIV